MNPVVVVLSALWLAYAPAPPSAHVRMCESYEFVEGDDGEDLLCHDNGELYDSLHYHLHHDADDGDIMAAEVWR